MASPTDIARFRLLIGGTTLTDEQIGQILDDNDGNFNSAGYEYWLGVAGSYAHMVSVSENGSDRKMSDLHGHALAQAKFYKDRIDSLEPGSVGVTNTRPIVRP